MFTKPDKKISNRIASLRAHLADENPLLVEVVKSYQELDKVGYRLGLLSPDESFATHISWWPLISVLGTFSAGKSTFINHYLGHKLQLTGNQAVDDRFTVVCYSRNKEVRVLPGLSLDADPRFPFYQISEEIEKVAKGEGSRIDTYLQLKTCPADSLRGRILIDSPGFDADEQRNSTLRITDHIIDLSDLVLVFFDARHPEPGAMQDTLEHLVAGTVRRNDASKVLFILNQVDTAAADDNIEAVVAAWQRALAQGGVASGRFYCIYNEDVAAPIEDPNLRARYQAKRDTDLTEIHERMAQVSVERVYRIIGSLENLANQIESRSVPVVRAAVKRWRRRVITFDLIALALALGAFLAVTISAGYWQGLSFQPPWLASVTGSPVITAIISVSALLLCGAVHFAIRRFAAKGVRKRLSAAFGAGNIAGAFDKNTRFWRSILHREPAGWGRGSRKRIQRTREAADQYVQDFNDRFANPSGGASLEAAPRITESSGRQEPKLPEIRPQIQDAVTPKRQSGS